jgi:PAS domain S-box-containing protein
MNKQPVHMSDEIIASLKMLAKGKEIIRRKLAITAKKLAVTAERLAHIAEVKEIIRRKLVVTAKAKEHVRRELAVTAEKLAMTANKLAQTAREKESVRKRRLAITAEKLALTAEKLAATAREKELVRRRLAVTAAKLAATAAKLVVTAEKLAVTAEKLAATAREKEGVRRKLALTAAKLAVTAEEKEVVRRKLAVTAREKEVVRRKLAVTMEKLKKSYATLEKKVLERTKSLEMARAKEEAVLLSIGDGLLATDEKGNIIFINKTAEKLLGKTSEEVMQQFFSDVIPLEDEQGKRIPLDKHPVSMVLVAGATTSSLSTAYYRQKNKKRFPMATMVTPVILDGKVIGTIKVFRDITSEREVDKAKTEFVSLASHQLRTPLSTVNWYAEMLLAGDVGELNEKQKKYLDEVYRSNQRMVELVNALLDVASFELGTFILEPEPTDICVLTKNVIDEQKPQIDLRKLELSFSCGNDIPLIHADPKLLRMVIQNILSNSVKYTPEGGKIDVAITLMNREHMLLEISDTGYGIPKNQQSKIFTKLFRADNVREKDTDGTGLGLYIVKSIIDNSGGEIWFTSPKGKSSSNPGTSFYIKLPLKGVVQSNENIT